MPLFAAPLGGLGNTRWGALASVKGGGGAYTVTELSALIAAAGGSWWRTADLTSMWQGIYGSGAAATGQVVGAMADIAQLGGLSLADYLAAATNLISNPGPFAATTGWSGFSGVGVSVADGELLVDFSTATSLVRVSTPITCTIGDTYYSSITFNRNPGTTGGTTSLIGTGAALTGGGSTGGAGQQAVSTTGADGTIDYLFSATASALYYGLNNTTVSGGLSVLSASVKRVPGRKAAATNTANRPLLLANNLLSFDGVNDLLVATIASDLGAACTKITADADEVVVTEGQTVGAGSYSLPDTGWTDHILLPVSLATAGINLARLNATLVP